jgi:peptidoglycan/LPS O-acetylase OafA/YrhL
MTVPRRPAELVAGAPLTAYRPYVDGLRAVSILLVVLYHVGVPGIGGGYVGVDVFLVISGFLIISQIIEAMADDRFSFGDFWGRRALRILPPYLLVISVSAAIAPFVLVMPDQLRDFGSQAANSAFMIVNHLFLRQQGYFDTPGDLKALLHLWSLSVEEQFYLAAPLLLAALFILIRRSRGPNARQQVLGWASAIIFVAALAGCIFFTRAEGHNPGFYLMPLRAWEFVAGGALGLLLPAAARLGKRAASLMAAIGLGAILVAALAYSPATLYPSAFAALPVAGAAALILAGLVHPRAAAVRLLGTRPMVAIGLVSYSWYLWHWPLLAFARGLHFGERLLWRDALMGLVSLGLAAATYHFVEKPIRSWRRRSRLRLKWIPAATGIAVCLVFGAGAKATFGHAADQRAAETIPARFQPRQAHDNPVCDVAAVKTMADCLDMAAGRPLGLLVGDSQAIAARNAIAGLAKRHGSLLVSYTANGCPAIFGVRVFAYDKTIEANCIALRQKEQQLLADPAFRPKYAILYSRWPLYATGNANYALGPAGADEPASDQAAFFVTGLRQTIAKLRALGVERIILLGPTPLFPHSAPDCLYMAERYGLSGAETCGVSRADHEALGRQAVNRIVEAIQGIPDVRFVDPTDDFCDADVCLPNAGDAVLFVDTNHLSDAGIERLIGRHEAEFEELAGRGS